MRLGLISRADNTGLGVQTWEYFRHLKPAKTLVIDVGHFADSSKHCNKRSYRNRYPGAEFYCGWLPPEPVLAEFLDGLDVVLGAETLYNPMIYPLARKHGVRTVVAPNWEFFDPTARPDLWIAPTLWQFDKITGNKALLPVPIATDRLAVRADFPTARPASHFLHIVGRPAVHDRNGTLDLLEALKHVTADIEVTIKCQDREFLAGIDGYPINRSKVLLHLDGSDVENYWDNYAVGDVLLMPRRFGGLCLPVNEAIGVGMPVIMPDISPNNTWLPSDWLIPAARKGSFRAKQHVDFYSVDHHALAAKIDQFATDTEFYTKAKAQAAEIRERLSWDSLRGEYQRVLSA